MLALILAPRHPARGDAVAEMLRGRGLRWRSARRASRSAPTPTSTSPTPSARWASGTASPRSASSAAASSTSAATTRSSRRCSAAPSCYGPHVRNFVDGYRRLSRRRRRGAGALRGRARRGARRDDGARPRRRDGRRRLGGLQRGRRGDRRGARGDRRPPRRQAPDAGAGASGPTRRRGRASLARLLAPLAWALDARRPAGGWRAGTAVRLGVPVICVGNLTAGGAGKTPTVIALVERLARPRRRARTSSRAATAAASPGPVRVDPAPAHAPPRSATSRCSSPPSPRSGSAATAPPPAAPPRPPARGRVVMDDGLQNPGLAKDLSIVVVDAGFGFGNGRVMPAGPLREPVADGLARADLLLAIGTPGGARPLPRRLAGGRGAARASAAQLAPLRDRHGLGAACAPLAFAGIGRPEKFFATLRVARRRGRRRPQLRRPRALRRRASLARLEAEAARRRRPARHHREGRRPAARGLPPQGPGPAGPPRARRLGPPRRRPGARAREARIPISYPNEKSGRFINLWTISISCAVVAPTSASVRKRRWSVWPGRARELRQTGSVPRTSCSSSPSVGSSSRTEVPIVSSPRTPGDRKCNSRPWAVGAKAQGIENRCAG